MRPSENDALLSRARLLLIISALSRAGDVAVSLKDIHAFSYFANVLAPLWDLRPLDGAILKEEDGPYYPNIQKEIDALIGTGFLNVEEFSYEGKAPSVRLRALVSLSPEGSAPALELISRLEDEVEASEFINELAYVFCEIDPNVRASAALFDASYSDPSISTDRVIDFAAWNDPKISDPSYRVAEYFQRFAPDKVILNRAEKLILYMRLIKKRSEHDA